MSYYNPPSTAEFLVLSLKKGDFVLDTTGSEIVFCHKSRSVLFLSFGVTIVASQCLRPLMHFYLSFCFSEVGASVDPAGVTMLDSVKIYGKTKEQFGWPEEPPEDFSSASVNNVCSPSLNQSSGNSDVDIATPTTTTGTVLERYELYTVWLMICPFTSPVAELTSDMM